MPGTKPHRPAVNERRAILCTRLSLLKVCRQIHAEWYPRYFGTTNIIVHGPNLVYWDPNSTSLVRQGRELTFDRVFLKVASQGVLGNLRKLRFDASLNRPLERIDDRVDSSVDWPNLRQFASMLNQHVHCLPRLQEVELYARLQSNIGVNSPQTWHNDGPATSQNAWKMVSEGGKWDEIQALMGGNDEGAVLAGWTITRNINVVWLLRTAPVYLHQLRGYYKSVHLHFAKPLRTSDPATCASCADPRTTMRFMNANDVLTEFRRDYESTVLSAAMGRHAESQD